MFFCLKKEKEKKNQSIPIKVFSEFRASHIYQYVLSCIGIICIGIIYDFFFGNYDRKYVFGKGKKKRKKKRKKEEEINTGDDGVWWYSIGIASNKPGKLIRKYACGLESENNLIYIGKCLREKV